MGFIYKIVNDINDKVYIGQTECSIQDRWLAHCNDSKYKDHNRPLYCAFNKYGIEHFKIELVEQCDTHLLSEREQYWIAEFDSYNNGYNATLGGEGTQYYDYKLIKEKWESGLSSLEVAKLMGCSERTVFRALNAYDIDPLLRKQRGHEKQSKAVYMLDLNTLEIIQRFPSMNEAARFIGDNARSSGIGRTCGDMSKSAYGYRWKYVDDNLNQEAYNKSLSKVDGRNRGTSIYKLDPDTEEILAEYCSIAEAARSVGGNRSTQNGISKAYQKNTIYYGYKWRLK